jgi:hypothetical protein
VQRPYRNNRTEWYAPSYGILSKKYGETEKYKLKTILWTTLNSQFFYRTEASVAHVVLMSALVRVNTIEVYLP